MKGGEIMLKKLFKNIKSFFFAEEIQEEEPQRERRIYSSTMPEIRTFWEETRVERIPVEKPKVEKMSWAEFKNNNKMLESYYSSAKPVSNLRLVA
jgi:hypothetical protein